jgi:hypothetical protein
MKKVVLTSVIFTLLCMSGYSQTLNKKTLCKKWYLEKYQVMYVDYEPDEKEKNDYILLKGDMTYESMDEGEKTAGKWTFNVENKYITMFNEKGVGIKINIDKLSIYEMVLNMDIKEMEGVDIQYTTKK